MTDMTPHPGSRLDATAAAALHELGGQAPEHAEAPDNSSNLLEVATRDSYPEESIPRTVFLSASNPYLMALPRDTRRRRAILIPITNPVYLCESRDLAQAAAAFVAGGGTSPGSGIGAYIPVGAVLQLEHRDMAWVVASTTATPSPVSVIVERYAVPAAY